MVQYLTRNGTIDDLAAAIDLVKELAKYEKEPNAVQIGLEEYKKAFAENLFNLIVAEIEDKIVGIAIFYPSFSTWKGKSMYLEDLIITDKHRNQGIGQALFNEFIKQARIESAVLVKWQVLDWNKHAIRFYLRNKAKIEMDWYNGIIEF